MYNSKRKKLCYEDRETLDRSDYKDSSVRVNGSDVDVTYYSDGTSKVHWGGPCGSSNYDQYGEEC